MNLQELYADERRAHSAEISFGTSWADRRGVPDPVPTRIIYLVETGELVSHGRDGLVQVLATFPLEPCVRSRCHGVAGAERGDHCEHCYDTGWSCRAVEDALEGWRHHETAAFGFAWMRRRTRAFRPAEAVA